MAEKKKGAPIILITFIALILIGAFSWLVWRYYPDIAGLTEPENMAAFKEKLHSFGVWGIFFLLGIQILQVISGIIPALPIQVAAGVIYGPVGGTFLCITGIFIGSALVFLTVKKFGQPVVDRMFPKEKQEKLSFLHHADRLNIIVFLLYLLPAMPKDVLTYLAALTPLNLQRFLGITIIARIPVLLGTCFAASAVMQGNYLSAAGVSCISGALGIVCMVNSKKILEKLKSLRKKK